MSEWFNCNYSNIIDKEQKFQLEFNLVSRLFCVSMLRQRLYFSIMFTEVVGIEKHFFLSETLRGRGGFLSGYPIPRKKIPIPGIKNPRDIPKVKNPEKIPNPRDKNPGDFA